MIPPHLLTAVMLSVITLWLISVVVILVEFRVRERRVARAAALLERLTADNALAADGLPVLTGSEFQELVHAGLPQHVTAAVAQELRAHEGDTALLAVASGTRHASTEHRIQAMQVLASGRHPETHTVLGAALRAPDAEIEAAALRLLKELNDEAAVRVLVEALAQGTYAASRIAAALDRMTAERGPLLGDLLKHESATVRFWALLLIGRVGASQWAAGVRALLTDASPMVRRAAVEALGRIGSIEDRHPVIERFFDPSPMVRVHAARAAAAFTDAGVADALVKLLSDREWVVRAAARDSLAMMGEVATAAATRTVWQGDPFAANNAAEVLFLTGATVRVIERLLEDPEDQEYRRLVERLIAASGPQIVHALHGQLEPGRQRQLQQLLGEPSTVAARVRVR